jgi:hypothetical protein
LKLTTLRWRGPRGAAAAVAAAAVAFGLCLAVDSAWAVTVTVTMPTPQGPVEFNRMNFAYARLAGPIGEFGCFTAGAVRDCDEAWLQAAVLGPDLETGLTLGLGALVTLAVPTTGSGLVFWEAGDAMLTNEARDLHVAVHTAAGWSPEYSLGDGHLTAVLNDTRPSGYATNFASLSAAELGLAPDAVFDAVRLRSCCDADAHFDLLAVAVVPEPGTATLLVLGLLGGALRAMQAGRRSAWQRAFLG